MCPTHPQNHKVNAFQAGINGSTIDNSTSGQVLTPEMAQQMIVSPFPALGLQGNDVKSNFWFVASGTSNHMTNSTSIVSRSITNCQYEGWGHYSNFQGCCFTKAFNKSYFSWTISR